MLLRGQGAGSEPSELPVHTVHLRKLFRLLGFCFAYTHFPKAPPGNRAGFGTKEDATFVFSISQGKAANATYTGAHPSSVVTAVRDRVLIKPECHRTRSLLRRRLFFQMAIAFTAEKGFPSNLGLSTAVLRSETKVLGLERGLHFNSTGCNGRGPQFRSQHSRGRGRSGVGGE